jgi:hypothetical protein
LVKTVEKANCIGHFLRRNFLVKLVIKGKIEERVKETGRRGRRHKQLLDDRKEKRVFCKLKEEALDRTAWRTGIGGDCRRDVRQKKE